MNPEQGARGALGPRVGDRCIAFGCVATPFQWGCSLWDLGSGICDWGFGIWGLASWIWNLGSAIKIEREVGIWDVGVQLHLAREAKQWVIAWASFLSEHGG